MNSTLAVTASALVILGYAETSINLAYKQDEVRDMWNGLGDQVKEGARAVLMGYILLAAEEGMPAARQGSDETSDGEGNKLVQVGCDS